MVRLNVRDLTESRHPLMTIADARHHAAKVLNLRASRCVVLCYGRIGGIGGIGGMAELVEWQIGGNRTATNSAVYGNRHQRLASVHADQLRLAGVGISPTKGGESRWSWFAIYIPIVG